MKRQHPTPSIYNLTPEQEKYIKEHYGRHSRNSIARKCGIKTHQLDYYIKQKNIQYGSDHEEYKKKVIDTTGWQRVPVPGIGNPVLLIPPGRDPEKARQKYIDRQVKPKKIEPEV